MAFLRNLFKFRSALAVDAVKYERERQAAYSRAIAAAQDADEKAISFIENRAGQPQSKLSDYGSFVEAGTGKVWAIFRACHLVGSALSSARISVVDKPGGNVIEPKIGGTDLASLLAYPNRFDTLSDLIYLLCHHLKLTGNAYWLKDEVDGAGRPKAAYPLLPPSIEIVPSRVDKIASYVYKVNGENIPIPVDQVIHFKRPNPASTIFGIGDVEAAAPVAEAIMDRDLLEKRFFGNGAQPSGILTKKEVVEDPAQWKAFRAKFNEEYAGKRNAGKVAFLNGDWSYLRLGLTSREMESIEHSKWSIEQMFAAMGVPLSLAGLREASNYATARVEELTFRRYECVPLLHLIVEKLNGIGGLSMPFGTQKVQYFMPGLIDVKQVVEDFGPLVKLGAMTPNELREKAGLLRVEDPYLDQYYVDNSRVPIEVSGVASAGAAPDPTAP